jgi:phosphoenolpyruvate carboxykinase (ATP)
MGENFIQGGIPVSSKANYSAEEIRKDKPGFSPTRSIIETPFYGNNVIKIQTLKEAYELAKKSPGTIVTDIPIYRGQEFGLDKDAKVLLFNDGAVTGRYSTARKIANEPAVDCGALDKILMDAVYETRWKTLYHAEVFVGLDPEFMVKAHLLIPKGEENIMYNWMLNFQYMSDEYVRMYRSSKPVGNGNEPDIYLFSDPQWSGLDRAGIDLSCLSDPKCLCYFNTDHNCAAILGMRYFGEHKKGTLTMAWALANRNGYASCHGGQKKYTLKDGSKYVASVFGLSGSGKSTLTHAKHDGKYEVTVLHDDAFIINTDTCVSVALEPTYFDKTQDYPAGCEDNKYLLTAQNCGCTLDMNGKIQLVTEDIRNGNGRAIKSRLWSPNRVDKIAEPVNAIFWIMKDPTIPPVVKLNGASLASVMGATLATKRSTAERLAPGIDPNALVVVPYANPFRTYPLANDYAKFKKLVEEKNVDCYIINTGDFMGKKVKPQDTLGIMEAILDGKASFHQWGPLSDIQIFDWEGFVPDITDEEYRTQLKARMEERLRFVANTAVLKEGYDRLPEDALKAIQKVVDELGM